jgi:hypothetical protein
MKLYRQRPVTVEAMQFDGKNHADIAEFIGDAMTDGGDNFGSVFYIEPGGKGFGKGFFMRPGNYIVRTVSGQFERWDQDNFAASFEEI